MKTRELKHEYVICKKFLLPACNVLLGKITFNSCTLPPMQRKAIIAGANAYLIDQEKFVSDDCRYLLVESVFGKYSTSYAYMAKAYYDLIRNLRQQGSKLSFAQFKAFTKRNHAVLKMEVDNHKAREASSMVKAKKDVTRYKTMYSNLVEDLIVQQQKEAKEYFDNYQPYKRTRYRRYDFDVDNRHRTPEDFVEELRAIYGDDYDYSQVKYANRKSLITLVCKKHDQIFTRTAANLVKGVGCPLCRKEEGRTWAEITASYDKTKINRRWTLERFVEESKRLYGADVFDYSKCKYVNNKTPVVLIRKSDGKFFRVAPCEHLRFSGTAEDEDKYYKGKTDWQKIYFLANRMAERLEHPLYIPMQHIVDTRKGFKCICPIHGEFASNLEHINKVCGCPDCNGSKESIGERNIRRYLSDLKIPFKQEYVIRDKRYFANQARVDFYLPENRVIIEFNGEQHYGIQNQNITHGSKTFEEQLRRDANLRLYAKDKGVELIEVPYIFRNNVGDYLDRYHLF